jgi:hypothetical protein
MDIEARKIIALKEELRRDLEAIERVERLMAFKNGSLTPPDDRQAILPINVSVGDKLGLEDEDDGRANSLKGVIETTVNADVNVRWTTQKMLAHLQQTGFNLRAKKPIYSVGQAMSKLAESGKIRIVRHGAGNQPNIYKGKQTEAPAKEQGGDIVTESTLTQ